MGEMGEDYPLRRDKRGRLTEGGANARASDRAFGLAFAAALAVIGVVARLAGAQTLSAWLFVISGALLIVAFLTPGALSPLNALRTRLMDSVTTPSPRCGFRRIIGAIWWNTLFACAGLLLVGLAGEAWLRLNTPFAESRLPYIFVPSVGLLRPSDTEVRITNGLDYWTISTTNALGFLDREPTGAFAAAECHVAVIGDSFVEALEVPLEDKFQVRLEERAATELSDLDVTVSAFGVRSTGQTHQLPLYDEYARPQKPELAVLVFVNNDFADNSPALYAMRTGYGPDGIPYATARRNQDGAIHLRPPSPDFERERLSPSPDYPLVVRHWRNSDLLFVHWLGAKLGFRGVERIELVRARLEELVRRPGYESMSDDWEPSVVMSEFFIRPDPPPVFHEALEFTAFALDEFVNRTEIDGAELVILASHRMGPSGSPLFELLADMAGERGIPVINQSDYIARQGGKIEDAHFAHDTHWSAQGHQWAAEALLEWLRGNPEVCDDADAA